MILSTWVRLKYLEQIITIQEGDELFQYISSTEIPEMFEDTFAERIYKVDENISNTLVIREQDNPHNLRLLKFKDILHEKNWFIKHQV